VVDRILVAAPIAGRAKAISTEASDATAAIDRSMPSQ
jgi:hypothetical protein